MDDAVLHTRYRRTSDTRFRAMGDEGMAIHQRNNEVMVLNDTGTRILQLLDGSTSVEQVLSTLVEEFDVDSATLHDDIQHYLSELETAGLIEIAG